MNIHNLNSLLGLLGLMGLAWLLSSSRRRVNWRVVGWGVALQLAIGALVFRAPGSPDVFRYLNDWVTAFLDHATAGQQFLFGPLAVPAGPTNPAAGTSIGFILAFQVLPIIIFFAAFMQLLYYVGIMQRIVQGFAWVFTTLMRISGAESLCAASNIFVGIESATAVRPHLAGMTRSELCTILTAGMATVAGNTMAAYVAMLSGVFPNIVGHLLSATLLSAPAAIVMSKLLAPETGEPATLGTHVKFHYERDPGAIAAIINGATAGMKMVFGIAALLIAFLGLVAVVNWLLGGAGGSVNDLLGWQFDWSLESLLGWVATPFALLMGVPWADAHHVGQLLGMRLVQTEFVAYPALAQMMEGGDFSDPRSQIISAYALCGFAHIASLAIFVGGIAALVPERRADLAAIGPRALLAATLACLMTGAVAGVFYTDQPMILSLGGP